MRLFVSAAAMVLVLTSCSFSKKNNEQPAKTLYVQAHFNEPSEGQKNLVAAVKLGDLSLVKKILPELKAADLDFSGIRSTPIGVAFVMGNLDVLEYLLGSRLSPFDLGDVWNQYSEMVFRTLIENSLSGYGHDFNREDDYFEMPQSRVITRTGEMIYHKQVELLGDIFEMIGSGDQNQAQVKLGEMGVGEQFFEEQVVFYCLIDVSDLGERDGERCGQLLRYLKTAKPTAGNSNRVQALYEAALLSQYKDQFKGIDLLVYLNTHPKLISTMWNIDNSGVWISPRLFRAMALNDQELTSWHNGCEKSECKWQRESRRSGSVFKLDDLRQNDFSLIQIDGNKMVNSFQDNSFLDQSLIAQMRRFIDRRPLGYSVENGVVDISGSKMSWSIGVEEKRKPRFPKDDTCVGFCELPAL